VNIIQPYAKILKPSLPDSWKAEMLRKVEWCGRISHRSEDAQNAASWERFIQAVVIGHGDWSITEHASVSVDMVVDRGITHELVRHRLFSFTQESTRFVNYEKKMPPGFILPVEEWGNEDQRYAWYLAIQTAEESYRNLLKAGMPPQLARSVFPNALASRIVITGNLRNWRHFFIMRTTKEAHPQMRQVTIPLLAEFKQTIPILYDDIQPNARQVDNLKLPR